MTYLDIITFIIYPFIIGFELIIIIILLITKEVKIHSNKQKRIK